MKRLMVLDCETTGLDPRKDQILELGMVVVSLPDFKPLCDFRRIIRPPCWDTVKRNLHPRVLEMHTENGLIAEINAADLGTLDATRKQACMWMDQVCPKTATWQSPLAGRNPSFDRAFLKAHMPALEQRFTYRHFEVSTITMLQHWVFNDPDRPSTAHRALPDCYEAIESVRSFLGLT